MKKNMQGFTLIELMIVVAIIAILAAIALPAYQDFIKRSKVSEAVAATSACKTSVAEFVASNNAFPTTADAAGCSTLTSQYTGALTVGANGVITIPVANISGDVTGNIILTPDTSQVANGRVPAWACSTTITQKYVPSSCRTAAAAN